MLKTLGVSLAVIAIALASCQRREPPPREAPGVQYAPSNDSDGTQERGTWPCPDGAPTDVCSRKATWDNERHAARERGE